MKIKYPTFTDEIQRDAYRFVLEYEALKLYENLKFGNKGFKGAEWEYDPENAVIYVFLDKENKAIIVINFPLENYPDLIHHVKNQGDAKL